MRIDMNTKIVLPALAIVIGVTGLVMVTIDSGWMTATGALLMLWGNNIDLGAKVKTLVFKVEK
jgi:hypothetical protein